MEIKRDRYLNKLISYLWDGQVKVITGIRRCGKSYLLRNLFHRYLVEQGVPEDHILTFALDLTRDIRYRDPLELAGRVREMVEGKGERFYLFVDEIHRLNRSVEEILYPAMEDYALDIIVGKGPSANSIRLDLPRFTLIGATTRSGMLTGPLRDRFGISFRLDYYSVADLADIVIRSATILGVQIDHDSACEIASRSRGTPRLANRLLKRVRDYAQVRGGGRIDEAITREALEFFEIDELGLDWMDIRILETLVKTFRGRPVGLTTLASAVGEDPNTMEDVYEPYLLQRGLIVRTPQGRVATAVAFDHLGIEPPSGV